MSDTNQFSYFLLSNSTADRVKIISSDSKIINFDTELIDLSFYPQSNVICIEDKHICSPTNMKVLVISGENGILANQWNEFGIYADLKKLTLSDSKQHHTTIEEIVEKTTQIRFLQLRNVGLTSIPINISNLKHIEFLDLSHNQIEEINSVLYLTSLQKLILDSNKVNRIERANFHARSLQHFSISGNVIQKLTMDMVIIRQLRYIDLSKNSITAFPHELLLLESVKVINCSHNLITTVPIITFLGKPVRIHIIDLSYNKLRVFPYNMLKRTEILDLAHNRITQLKAKYFYKLSQDSNIFYQGTTILLIGNKNSGKSNLIHSILQNHGIYGEYRPTVGISVYDELEIVFQDVGADSIPVNINLVELAGNHNYVGPLEDFYNQIPIIWLVVNLKEYENEGFEECLKPWIDLLSYRALDKHLVVVCTHKDLCRNSTQLLITIKKQTEEYIENSFELMRTLKTKISQFDDQIPGIAEFLRRLQLISEASGVTLIGVDKLLNQSIDIIKKYCCFALKPIPSRWMDFIDFFETPEDGKKQKIIWNKDLSTFKTTLVTNLSIFADMIAKLFHHDVESLVMSTTRETLNELGISQKVLNKAIAEHRNGLLTPPLLRLLWIQHHDDIIRYNKHEEDSSCYIQKLSIIKDYFKSIYFKKTKGDS
ncbi:malignant fibrous histiocytoma-amplified sequence 1 homolog [Octopus sinensis]|uniref:Malignant fibrous histiocytoma-amplified sequence 1 homolog n=1 Tax=Octopus sinensis TaxID=2607531 RepID=A0A7E6EH86_9MOLL|nr:malignant fibrous histiocytoma-amplified sequence 1 homolog [Octopus sinensis]